MYSIFINSSLINVSNDNVIRTLFNWLGSDDAIRRHKPRSSWAQLMIVVPVMEDDL